MDKLLQEAIADAKSVRETALANAKLALEEAFTPHLKSMLSKKLQAEADDEGEESQDQVEGYHGEDEDEDDIEEDIAPSDIGKSDNHEPSSAANEADAQGPEDEGSASEAGMEDENMDKDSDQPMGENAEMSDEDEDIDEGEDMEGGMHDEDEEVAEVLRQLEQEMGMSDEDESMDEPMEGDMEAPVEEPAAEHEEMEMSDEDEDIDLDEIIKALTTEDDDEEEVKEEEEPKEDDAVSELEEYKQTVMYLKDKLSEVNLLNAKLLYTNKLFRSRNVSETQKMKVIEQFDRASNVREVKLVYTTFAESMERTTVNESAKRKSQASKPVASTESKKTKIIGESVDFVDRMKKLANII